MPTLGVEFRNRLQSRLGSAYPLPPTLAFDYPTIRGLAAQLAEQLLENYQQAVERAKTAAKTQE